MVPPSDFATNYEPRNQSQFSRRFHRTPSAGGTRRTTLTSGQDSSGISTGGTMSVAATATAVTPRRTSWLSSSTPATLAVIGALLAVQQILWPAPAGVW